jgi:hypothetical protein
MLASRPSSAETTGAERGIMENNMSEIKKIAKCLLPDVLVKNIPLLFTGRC